MDRVSCKACGGALERVAPAQYRCVFCGTAYELARDDVSSVRALLEQNNERWLRIHKQMDAFFEAVNRAAVLSNNTRIVRTPIVLFNLSQLAVVAALAFAFYGVFADSSRTIVFDDLVPFAVFAGIAVVVDVLYVGRVLLYRSQVRSLLAQAQGIVDDVLATYRQMSERPAGELLATLHDPKSLIDENAQSLARQIYDRVAASSQAPQA